MTTIPPGIEPESILLVASGLWVACALATGIPDRRFPSEFPFLFASVGFVAAMIGVTEIVPETVGTALTALGVILFAALPIFVTVKLYQAYPPIEENPNAAAN